jgi:hypothetical protein
MFDYSKSLVRPWPAKLPFRSRHTTLTDVRWAVEGFCDLTVEHRPPGGDATRWRFRADAPLDVIIQEDEGQAVSLWMRRSECSPGEEGFLVVEASPILRAIRETEPHVEPTLTNVQHFVIGTDDGVAHVLCEATPSLEQVAS